MVIPHDPAGDGQHPDRADPAEPKGRMLNAAQVAEILGGSYTAATVVRRYRHWELTAFRIGRNSAGGKPTSTNGSRTAAST